MASRLFRAQAAGMRRAGRLMHNGANGSKRRAQGFR
jgi:hypothetical protein